MSDPLIVSLALLNVSAWVWLALRQRAVYRSLDRDRWARIARRIAAEEANRGR